MSKRWKTSRAQMRHHVIKHGGHYSRQSKRWVLPGARHNCTPWQTETQWLTLEEAYERAADSQTANQAVEDFGDKEAAYLRLNFR